MNDGPTKSKRIDGLKAEWERFWSAFRSDEASKMPSIEDDLPSLDAESFSLEELKKLTRSLSQSRKRLNVELESIKKELDETHSTLENLHLVGSSLSSIEEKIGELNEQGFVRSRELSKLDERLKLARSLERKLRLLEKENS